MTATEKKVVYTEPKVVVRNVTPDQAEAWLARNHDKNRTRRKRKVEEYAADMRAGRWHLGTQVVVFNTRDELVNGQHTLEAVVRSGATVPLIVLFGCSDVAMMMMDSGMKRSSDDHFGMAGRDYPRGCGATVRRIVMGPTNFADRAITDQTIDQFMQEYGDKVAFVHKAMPKGRYAAASIRAVCSRAMIRKVAGEKIERFAEVMNSGIMSAGETAAVMLMKYVDELKSAASGSGTERRNLYAVTETALTAFLAGERLDKLKPAESELFPIPNEKRV